MKLVATGKIQPLASTEKFVALQIDTESGEPLIMEFPIESLPELSFVAVQIASMCAQRRRAVFEPPRLPVAKWSVAPVPETGDIVLKFEYPVAGAHGFRIDRATALALHSGLGQVLEKKSGAN
jgi:hypothetical protein